MVAAFKFSGYGNIFFLSLLELWLGLQIYSSHLSLYGTFMAG
jgi:hypothetical protein